MRSRFADDSSHLAARPTPILGGPTFGLKDRLLRLAWTISWTLLASWTPPQFQPLRRLLLTAFGADIHPTAMVRGTARIWWPRNLSMGAHSSLGPGVVCYNVARIAIDDLAVISQRAHLCTGSHDIDHPDFPLTSRPIRVGLHAWVASEAFVGPGVDIGEGAVLGARGVATRTLDAWTVYAGNPARPVRLRERAAIHSSSDARQL